ncbi:MAG: FAD-dependent oxidoreductase [Aphanocapsa sp. GSE-SYN-MK-11-07L]|jgi:monoamine oxidase|nr:FAD-dependent oxidoreductase [Aphanocapsa sp. GSE-SYN-MK-11-07L]
MNLNVDAAIIGAGISGLSAAWQLQKLGIKSFVVLEARSRVGGRTFSELIGTDTYVEQGGTWAGLSHREFLALASELGIATKPGQRAGDFLFKIGDRWTTLEAPDAFSSNAARQDFEQVLSRFETLRRSLPQAAPWSAEDAEGLDALTMQDWIEQNTTTMEGRAWFTGITRQTISGDLRQVSLLWMLHFFNTTGDVFLGLNVDAEGIRFVGGSQQLSLKLAERLGNQIWLDAPVRQIAGYDSSQVQIMSDRGTVRAKTAIVAMMPKDVKSIEFQPLLPILHRQLIDEWRTMSWAKFYAFYEKPFWQSQTTGSHFLDETTRFDVYDVSPDDGSQGILVGLLSPDYASLSAPERKACCLNFLAEICGDAARRPQNFVEFDWNRQAWTGGCITALPLGVFSKIGSALNQPVGCVYWAGTERSLVWTNYIEGAIRSGQQAADQIAAQLR